MLQHEQCAKHWTLLYRFRHLLSCVQQDRLCVTMSFHHITVCISFSLHFELIRLVAHCRILPLRFSSFSLFFYVRAFQAFSAPKKWRKKLTPIELLQLVLMPFYFVRLMREQRFDNEMYCNSIAYKNTNTIRRPTDRLKSNEKEKCTYTNMPLRFFLHRSAKNGTWRITIKYNKNILRDALINRAKYNALLDDE